MFSKTFQMQRECYSIGIDCMVLFEDYDERQEWLPFVQAFLQAHSNRHVEEYEKPLFGREVVQSMMDDAPVLLSHADDWLYHYRRDVPQYVLPFPSRKKVHCEEFRGLEKAGFPTWDRTNDGEIIGVRIPRGSEINAKWVSNNFKHRFYIVFKKVYCERREDAQRLIEYLKTMIYEVGFEPTCATSEDAILPLDDP